MHKFGSWWWSSGQRAHLNSNPAEVYNFSVKLLLKRTKICKKESGVGSFFRKKPVHKSGLSLRLLTS